MPQKDSCSKQTCREAPFEWLTSPSSLDPFLERITFERALHVGCGSSRLGEHLVERWDASTVVNVDVDKAILEKIQSRWKDRFGDEDSRMKFVPFDYSGAVTADDDSINPCLHGPFNLIVDKSTLDCLLCTETAAANLLHHVYNSLNGVYLLVSFHHRNLLLPLLEGLGQWSVELHVLKRQVESLGMGSDQTVGLQDEGLCSTAAFCENGSICDVPAGTQWSSGSFEPDSEYHQFVNVVLCHKETNDTLQLAEVKKHVTTVCNHWWTQMNPILSHERIEKLKVSFGNTTTGMTLPEAYEVMFTEAEKEHLGYDGFLEDWQSFVSKRNISCEEHMTLGTALEFLEEVQ